MHRLPHALSDNSRDIRPPNTWQEFQELCTDAFSLIQTNFNVPRRGTSRYWAPAPYGKNGNKQCGIDVIDHFSNATMQCKRVTHFNLPDLEKEIKELIKYKRPIDTYFIATSLDEITVKVLEYIEENNRSVEAIIARGGSSLAPPAIRLPKIYILSWPEIKSIISKDRMLAMKWGISKDDRYPNLNSFDLTTLLNAMNSVGCFLPPSSVPCSDVVQRAIDILTEPLNVVEIALLGQQNKVKTEVIDGLGAFIRNVEETINVVGDISHALHCCEDLDVVRRSEALSVLNEKVIYHGRISALKYLNCTYDEIQKLYFDLSDEQNYELGYSSVMHNGEYHDYEDHRVRLYNFSCNTNQQSVRYLNPHQVSKHAQFIARQIYLLQNRTSFSRRH